MAKPKIVTKHKQRINRILQNYKHMKHSWRQTDTPCTLHYRADRRM